MGACSLVREEREKRERGEDGRGVRFFSVVFISLYSLLCLGLGLFLPPEVCYNCSCSLVGLAVSVLASSSVFSGLVSVGFSGSRSPSPRASAALSGLLPLVPAGGFPPSWSGVSWSVSRVCWASSVGGGGGCWWLGVPAPRVLAPSLF